MESKTKVPVPVFKENYEQYANKVKIWSKVCGLEEKQKASVLWLNLPDDHPSDIKEKIFNELEDDFESANCKSLQAFLLYAAYRRLSYHHIP